MYWWDNQLFSVKSRQKFLWRMTSHHTRIFYCNDMKERIKLLSQENKVSKFCKEAGFMRVVEVGQYFMTKDTGSLTQFRSVALSRIHFTSRWSSFTSKRMDSRKHENWACVGSHDQFFNTSNMELKPESGLWVKIIFNLGSEYPMERSNMWSIQIKTIQKFLQTHKKIKCHKQATGVVAARSKAKAKPQQRELVGTTATIPMHGKKMDWHWAIRTKSCLVRSLEESDQSSSTQSNVTARRRCIQMPTNLGRRDRMDHNFSKLQKLWWNQWRADWIRVEHFPRIRYIAALW